MIGIGVWPGDVGDRIATAGAGCLADQLGDDVGARGAQASSGPRRERLCHQLALPLVRGAVEAEQAADHDVPQLAGGEALGSQGDTFGHRESVVAQDGSDEVPLCRLAVPIVMSLGRGTPGT